MNDHTQDINGGFTFEMLGLSIIIFVIVMIIYHSWKLISLAKIGKKNENT